MGDRGDSAMRDDIVAFDNYMEVVADASVMELTTDVGRFQPTTTTPEVDDVDAAARPVERVGRGGGRCRALWRRVYRLLSSNVGLILLLVVYTLVGAAVLHQTEYDREQQMHAQLDRTRRRVVADIVNLTTAARSRDRRVKSRDLSGGGDVALAAAVEALVVEYGDTREALRPNSKSPGWTFTGAAFFCGTVYTTIGYGNLAPVTTVGRCITIVYALIGIPLCLIVLASVGKLLTRAIKYIWMYVRRFFYTGSCRRVRRMIPISRLRMTLLQRIGYQFRRRTGRFRRAVRRRKVAADRPPDEDAGRSSEDEGETCVPYEVDDEFNLPPAVALAIGMTYMLLGALMYTFWEDWTYFEAIYFTVVSLSTIGFGDVVPDHPRFFMASSVYLVVGLALLAMILNVLMVALHLTITKATTRVIRRVTSFDITAEVDEPEIVVAKNRPQLQFAPPSPPPLRRPSPPLNRRRSV